MIRRLIAPMLIPLTIIATGLAAAPWLRAFPSSVLTVPLLGAVLLSVLVPVAAVLLGVRRLWQTALIDVAVWLLFQGVEGMLVAPFEEIARGPVATMRPSHNSQLKRASKLAA